MQKSCHHEKTVQITLYVVNPERTKHASSQVKHAAHCHHKLRNSGGGGGVGYDRKAQLLLYSREMRAVACRKQPPMIHKPQPQNKVKEAIQIAFSHKSQPQKKKVKEATQIASSPKPQRQVAESLLKVAASQQPRHFEKKSVLNSSSAISKSTEKEAQQRNRTSAWKVVPVGQKSFQAKLPQPPPSCFGDWKKVIFPKLILRTFGGRRTNGEKIKKRTLSGSLSNKMKTVVMSTRMEKERIGVMAKFLSAMGKHR